MAKAIMRVDAEIHIPDTVLTPDEHLDALLALLADYASERGGITVVVRTNAFYEPLPESPPEPPSFPVDPGPSDG